VLFGCSKTNYTAKDFDVLSATDGYLSNYRSYQGIRFIGQAEFVGDNKGTNAGLNLWIKPDAKESDKKKMVDKVISKKKSKKKQKAAKEVMAAKADDAPKKDKKKEDKIKCFVVDAKGDTIRTFTRKVDKDKKGLVQIGWNMRADGLQRPSRRDPKPDQDLPSGMNVLPGTYTIIAQYGDHTDQAEVEVKLDPRVTDVTEQDIKDLAIAYDNLATMMEKATTAFNKLKKAKKKVELIEKLTETVQDTTKKAMAKLNKSTKQQLDNLSKQFVWQTNAKCTSSY